MDLGKLIVELPLIDWNPIPVIDIFSGFLIKLFFKPFLNHIRAEFVVF
ncbi:hypothetical protein [Methanobrevibacter sp. DSM 116169]